MKSRLAAVALAATAALSLAACGNGIAGQQSAAATQAAPANFCDALKATDGQHSDDQRQALLNQAYALAPSEISDQMLVVAQYAGTQLRNLDESEMEELATATTVVHNWRVANCAS